MRMTTSYPKISNRERQRLAQQSVVKRVEMQTILCAVLAQKGGEVTVTEGTIAQIRPGMDYEVVISPTNPKERIVRLVQ